MGEEIPSCRFCVTGMRPAFCITLASQSSVLRHTKPITRLSWAYKNQTTEM